MKIKKDITEIYPIKKAKEMSDEEFSRWWAFIESLDIIFKHADKLGMEIEDININVKKMIDEYISPISGDIMNDIKNIREKKVDRMTNNTRFALCS